MHLYFLCSVAALTASSKSVGTCAVLNCAITGKQAAQFTQIPMCAEEEEFNNS